MRVWPAAVLLVAWLLLAPPTLAVDADGDTLDDAEEQSLLEAYAPVLYFHPKETYFPTEVRLALDNSRLERYTGGAPQLLDANPTPAALAAFTDPNDPVFLNNTDGSVSDDSGIAAAYGSGGYAATVYGRAVPDSGMTVLQYWLFYAFNPAAWNRHEGDWEMVEVFLLNGAPFQVAYSQHRDGQQMGWADIDASGTHPRVYVARGSHASYLKPYQGRVGSLAGDEVSDAGPVWSPGSYAIVNLGEAGSPLAGNEWLSFAGRWGEFSPQDDVRGDAGPPGPAFRESGEMFASPVQWADRLAVPSSTELQLNWLFANLLLLFVIFVAVAVTIRLLLLWRAQKKTKAGRKLHPYAHLRPFDAKSAGMIVGLVGVVIGLVAALLPWYVVTMDVDAPGFLDTNGPRDFIVVDGVNGLSIDPLRPEPQVVRASLLPLPVGIMLAVTSALFFFKITGKKTSRRLGGSFLLKGIVALLPFLFVVIVASLVLPAFGGEGGGGGESPTSFLGAIGASPFGGQARETITDDVGNPVGSVAMTWGLGPGAWLLLASAIILFVAAGLLFSKKYYFLPQWYVDGFDSQEQFAAANPVALVPAAPLGTAPYPPPPGPGALPPPPPGFPAPAGAWASPDHQARLVRLREMRDRGLIDEEVYAAKRESIIDEMMGGGAPPMPMLVPVTPGAPPPGPPTRGCASCGAALPAGASACGACGRPAS